MKERFFVSISSGVKIPVWGFFWEIFFVADTHSRQSEMVHKIRICTCVQAYDHLSTDIEVTKIKINIFLHKASMPKDFFFKKLKFFLIKKLQIKKIYLKVSFLTKIFFYLILLWLLKWSSSKNINFIYWIN